MRSPEPRSRRARRTRRAPLGCIDRSGRRVPVPRFRRASAFITGTVLTVDGGVSAPVMEGRRSSRSPARRSARRGALPPFRRRAGDGSRAERHRCSLARGQRERATARPRRGRDAAADVSDAAQVDAVVGLAVECFGHLDVLISNAGGSRPTGGSTTSRSRTREGTALRTNVLGAVNGIRAAVLAMRAQRSGSIVLTASGSRADGVVARRSVLRDEGGGGPVAKAAAVEYAETGIRVNCVCPGTFRSGIHDASRRRRSTRSRASIRSDSGRRPTWSTPTRTWPGRRVRRHQTTGSAMVVDGDYAAP